MVILTALSILLIFPSWLHNKINNSFERLAEKLVDLDAE
jgi:hypothetical protein